MNRIKRLLFGCVTGLLAVCMATPLIAGAANVYERPDMTRETSLEIHYHQGTTEFDDVQFKVYRVADMTETVRFKFTDVFNDYPVYFTENMTASDWVGLADTMAAYAERDNLHAGYSAVTDEQGRIKLDDMGTGLYLVVGGSHEREYTTEENGQQVTHHVYYHVAPFLVATPSLDENLWNYDVEISPKFSMSEEATISKRVLIVWDDEGYEDKRPDKLFCDLLRDEELYDTVELNAENLWRYQWDNLDNSYQWRVVGYGADGYRVTIDQEGMTTVVTNWYRETEPVNPDNPDEPTLPTPPTTDIFDDTPPLAEGEPGKPSDKPVNTPSNVSSGTLPQTGQLWWPVPVLFVTGCAMFFVGFVMLKKSEKEQ